MATKPTTDTRRFWDSSQTAVIIDCSRCYGEGKVIGATPSGRSRFVSHDDLCPDDFTIDCPTCEGTGVVEVDLTEEAE